MYPELIKGFLCLPRTFQEEGREGFQRATAKPFGRARRRETLCRITQNDNMLSLSQTHQRNSMLFPNSSKDSLAYPELTKGKAAKVSKGRPQSPLVASAEAKPSVTYKEMIIAILIPNSSRENLRPLRMEGAKNAVDFQDGLIPSAVRRPASWRRNTPGQR